MKKLRQQFADSMVNIGEKDENLVLIVSDISHGILQSFANKFHNRYFNIGICEPSIVNMCAGLNKVGLIPVVHTIAPFLIERSYEQIKLDFGYQKLDVNLISVGGSFDYSKLGCSHHCYSDIALLSQFKESMIFTPGSASEFERQIELNYNKKGIKYFRLTEHPHDFNLDESIEEKDFTYKIFEGNDITLVTYGSKLNDTIKVAKKLQNDGISVELIYYSRVKPFNDEFLLSSFRKINKLVSIEETSVHGSFSNFIYKTINKVDQKIHYLEIGVEDFIHNYGSYEDLSLSAGIDEKSIYNKIISFIRKHD